MILKNTNQRFEWFGIYRVCAKVQGIFVAGLECTNVSTALRYVCVVLLIEHIRTGSYAHMIGSDYAVLASRSYVLLYVGLHTVLNVQPTSHGGTGSSELSRAGNCFRSWSSQLAGTVLLSVCSLQHLIAYKSLITITALSAP